MKNQANFHNQVYTSKQYGGAALEYVVVSIFGLALSMAAITFVSTSMKSKFDKLAKVTGVEFDIGSLDLFGNRNE